MKPIHKQPSPTIVRAIAKPAQKIISRKTIVPAKSAFDNFVDLENSEEDIDHQGSKNEE